jgi:hypothetical protein
MKRAGKLTVISLLMTTVLLSFLGVTALAGQGPSQWCSDNVGYEEHIINSPATFNVEAGGPVGPQGWSWIVCASPTPWGDGTPAPTGGAAWFGSTQGATGGNNWIGCGSDNNSTVLAFGCNDQVDTNLSNPLSPSAGVTYNNGINVAGIAGAQTGCQYGYTAGTGGIGCGPGGYATRPSQWCADNYGNENPRVIHDPVTLDFEPGNSPGNYNYLQTCYSSSPWNSGGSEVTGGGIVAWTPTLNGAGLGCYSDGNATVRLDCGNGIGLNTSNSTDPRANTNIGSGVNVAGNQVSVPSVGAGTDCAGGTVALSAYSCANGQYLGISGTGASASGYNIGGQASPGLAISGTNNATGGTFAVSGNGGSATSNDCVWASGTCYREGAALSPTGFANNGRIAGSATNNASQGWLTVSALGCAAGPPDQTQVAISGTGCASSGVLALSGTGTSTGTGFTSGAISGTGNAINDNPNGVAISATNWARGSLLAVSPLSGAEANGYAISGLGNAYSSNPNYGRPWYAISGAGNAESWWGSISGTGNATSYGDGTNQYGLPAPGTAISGAGNSNARNISISGAGSATGGSIVNVGGGGGTALVTGYGVSVARADVTPQASVPNSSICLVNFGGCALYAPGATLTLGTDTSRPTVAVFIPGSTFTEDVPRSCYGVLVVC